MTSRGSRPIFRAGIVIVTMTESRIGSRPHHQWTLAVAVAAAAKDDVQPALYMGRKAFSTVSMASACARNRHRWARPHLSRHEFDRPGAPLRVAKRRQILVGLISKPKASPARPAVGSLERSARQCDGVIAPE